MKVKNFVFPFAFFSLICTFAATYVRIMIKEDGQQTTEKVLEAVVEGLQGKKGRQIVVANLEVIPDTICKRFVICTGGSPNQVQALAQSVGEKVRELTGVHPIAVSGMRNSVWVAMDYSDVMVHIFLPEERAFYDLEHLWADAELTEIPDLD
mgnify:CR=1 FL=1